MRVIVCTNRRTTQLQRDKISASRTTAPSPRWAATALARHHTPSQQSDGAVNRARISPSQQMDYTRLLSNREVLLFTCTLLAHREQNPTEPTHLCAVYFMLLLRKTG